MSAARALPSHVRMYSIGLDGGFTCSYPAKPAKTK